MFVSSAAGMSLGVYYPPGNPIGHPHHISKTYDCGVTSLIYVLSIVLLRYSQKTVVNNPKFGPSRSSDSDSAEARSYRLIQR